MERAATPVLELDLIGHQVTLSAGEASLLLTAAEAASGSSIGSRDLATRLKALANPTTRSRRRLVLSRSESRSLQRVIETQIGSTDQLHDLRSTLAAALNGGQA
jgi:hypothetical protein